MTPKTLIKKLIPPLLLESLRPKNQYGFFGNYRNWQDARADATGYDSPIILGKATASALKVRQGGAKQERDGVPLSHPEYSWPVVSMLLWAAGYNNNTLNVTDFGGSLGTGYEQNKLFLNHLSSLKWHVVEQQSFVEIGKKNFQNEQLGFYDSLEAAMKDVRPDIFLASSSIQYPESPHAIEADVVQYGYKFIVFDRTPMWDKPERLTLQKVPPRIYDASYPAWIFNKTSFKKYFADHGYECVAEIEQGTMSYDGKAHGVTLMHMSFRKKN